MILGVKRSSKIHRPELWDCVIYSISFNGPRNLNLMFPAVEVAHIGGSLCIYSDVVKLGGMVAMGIYVEYVAVLPLLLLGSL